MQEWTPKDPVDPATRVGKHLAQMVRSAKIALHDASHDYAGRGSAAKVVLGASGKNLVMEVVRDASRGHVHLFVTRVGSVHRRSVEGIGIDLLKLQND